MVRCCDQGKPCLSGSYLQDFAKQSRRLRLRLSGSRSTQARWRLRSVCRQCNSHCENAKDYAELYAAPALLLRRHAVEAEQAEAAAVNATKLARQTATEATRAADQATVAFLKAESDAAKSTQQVLAASAQAEASIWRVSETR
jgi:hypothetical protein